MGNKITHNDLCSISTADPMDDLHLVYKEAYGVYENECHVYWYVGKASKDLLLDKVCKSKSRQIESFCEHLPSNSRYFKPRAQGVVKILTRDPEVYRSFFYVGLSEKEVFFRFMSENRIRYDTTNLNISLPNGAEEDNCYLHIYITDAKSWTFFTKS